MPLLVSFSHFCARFKPFPQQLSPESGFKFFQLFLDQAGLFLIGYHILPITLQEIADCLYTYLDGTSRLIFVDVLETEVRGSRVFHDLFYHGIDRSVMSA